MPKQLNLAEMAQGAFMEQFHRELNKVLANIADPNTDAKKARKITLTITLKPDENRDVVAVDAQSKSVLVPAKSLSTRIVIDREKDGTVVGAELNCPDRKGKCILTLILRSKDDKGKVVSIQR